MGRVMNISISKEYNKCFDEIEAMGKNKSRMICKAIHHFISRPIILEDYNLSTLSKKELESLDKRILELSNNVIQEIESR